MKYKLINLPNPKYNAKQQILINRGLKEEDLNTYMNLTKDVVNDPAIFGKELMDAATACFMRHFDNKSQICVIVDCDCDGYTSAAILINYIYYLSLTNPEYVNNRVDWFMHDSKQHGLGDCMDWITDIGPDLVVIPDAGSNDVEQLRELESRDIDAIILDHHEIEEQDFWNTERHPHLFLINSQLPQYPNKDLSGAGVVWQFCRYIDQTKRTNYADQSLDLVALGNDGDMMSLQSFETRYLISEGLKPNNIRNPFIYEMWQKNKFKLGDEPTAWGATFYIVPLVNAITRSGTLEEKELIFSSMLEFRAFKVVPSTKRGHKFGETERIVDQAIRTCTNVKNRQTREEEKGLELVEHLIEDNNMMEHKVLLFLLEPGQIQPEIRGLIANKLMAKYQRPCCMLTKCIRKVQEDVIVEGEIGEDGSMNFVHIQGDPWMGSGRCPKIIGHAWGPGILETEKITYEGSARGCDKVGVTEFKDICAATQVCDYTIGHQGAFGLGLPADKIDEFLQRTDMQLANMSSEPVYYVDYIWHMCDVDPEAILEIGEMDKFWGKNCDEALVAIKGLQITKDMLQMMASNTVKISLPNGVSIIKFRMPDEEYDKLWSENGYVQIDVVGTCNVNEWNGNRFPQILLADYEITGGCAYVF